MNSFIFLCRCFGLIYGIGVQVRQWIPRLLCRISGGWEIPLCDGARGFSDEINFTGLELQ